MSGRRRSVAAVVCLILLLATLTAAFLAVFISDDTARAARILGSIVAAGGLLLPIGLVVIKWWRTPPAPEDPETQMAMATQVLATQMRDVWASEANARGLEVPATIMVAWGVTRRGRLTPRTFDPLAGARATAHATDTGLLHKGPRVLTKGVLDDLHLLYRKSDRLVILGQGGSGKSGALILLLLAALKHRDGSTAPQPVPVLLPLGDWEPGRQKLTDWAADAIYRDNDYLRNPAYGISVVQRLIADNRVALFLDGLDELAAGAHMEALQEIGRSRPAKVVLTSRPSQFEDAVRLEGLANALMIELRPVSAAMAGRYLTAAKVGRRGRQWVDLARKIYEQPGSPVARALNLPLWLSLARSAYTAVPSNTEETDKSDPTELADVARFPTPKRVRRHLLERTISQAFLPTEYSGRATDYLRVIAGRMPPGGLAWWQIRLWLPWAPFTVIAVPIGIAGGMAMGLVGGVRFGAVFGVTIALTGAVIGGAVAAVGVRRLGGAVSGDVPRHFVAVALGLAYGASIALMSAIEDGLVTSGAAAGTYGVSLGVASGVALGLVGLHDGPLVAIPRRPALTDVTAAIATGAVSALTYGAIAGIARGLLVGTTASFAILLGVSCMRPAERPRLRMNPRNSFRGDAKAALLLGLGGGAAAGLGVAFGVDFSIGVASSALVCFACAITVGLTLATGASQAVALTIVSIGLRATGQAPLRLLAFLEEARRRGILRRAGTLYQFRHAELQGYLREADEFDRR